MKPPPWRSVALLVALVVVVALVASRWADSDGSSGESAEAVPDLGAPSPACPVPKERAMAHASRVATDGRARGARYAFDPHEGVVARAALVEASACARSAGQPAVADALAERAREWATRLQGDYRSHQVALAIAVEREDGGAIRRAASWLERLLSGRGGSYRQWLVELVRAHGEEPPP